MTPFGNRAGSRGAVSYPGRDASADGAHSNGIKLSRRADLAGEALPARASGPAMVALDRAAAGIGAPDIASKPTGLDAIWMLTLNGRMISVCKSLK